VHKVFPRASNFPDLSTSRRAGSVWLVASVTAVINEADVSGVAAGWGATAGAGTGLVEAGPGAGSGVRAGAGPGYGYGARGRGTGRGEGAGYGAWTVGGS
jgi:hypothetical protein